MPDAGSAARGHLRLSRRKSTGLALLGAAVIGLLALDALVGPAGLLGSEALRQALSGAGMGSDTALGLIVWEIRLPQALMALSIGAALGLAGAEMQTVLDNPLASPFTLGISSAAALGAALTLVLGLHVPGVSDSWALTATAFVFAAACAALLDGVARRARLGAAGIVLFGIALVFTFNALLSLVQFVANASALQDLVFWMMGSLARSSWPGVIAMLAALLAVAPFSMRSAWQLTALRFGEERAVSFGVDTRRVRRASLLRISLLSALAVSLVGVIGFVGLIAPHIARSFWGEDHRWYLPASALVGSAILIASAIAAKLVSPSFVLPVGIVTTLVGIPFFVAAVMRRQAA